MKTERTLTEILNDKGLGHQFRSKQHRMEAIKEKLEATLLEMMTKGMIDISDKNEKIVWDYMNSAIEFADRMADYYDEDFNSNV